MHLNLRPRLRLILGLAALIFLPSLSAQVCGVTESIDPFFDRSDFEAFQRTYQKAEPWRTIRLIPIRFHVVRNDLGQGGLTEEKINFLQEDLNRFYAGMGIQFEMCRTINFIDNEGLRDVAVYSFPELLDRYSVANEINVFVVRSLSIDYIQLCGYANFPWDNKDFIAMSEQCATTANYLAHEMGHFFGLYHTHSTINGRELVDGSNCDLAGDLICDTTADPQLNTANVDVRCRYTGSRRDPNGQLYQPDTYNVMSYSRSVCLKKFTDEQFERMAYYMENERNYLFCSSVFPDLAANSVQPSDNRLLSGTSINIDFEISNIGDTVARSTMVDYHISEDNNFDLEDEKLLRREVKTLKAGESIRLQEELRVPLELSSGNYYILSCIDQDFLVDESNESNNCIATPVEIDNSRLGIRNVYPNPVVNESFVFVKDNSRGLYHIQLRSTEGQLLMEKRQFKSDPELHVQLSLQHLPRGVYLVNLIFEQEAQQFKVLKL